VQPEHLRLLPLTHRQLATGLLAAAFVGPAPVINLVAFSGLIVLAAQLSWAAALVALLGVVLQLIFVVVLSRVVLAWIGAAMRSRRGRDLGVLLAGLAGLAYYPMSFLLSHVQRVREVAPWLADVLRWLPSGWAPRAVEAAAQRDWIFALLPLAGLLALAAVLWQAWSVLLRRRLAAPMGAAAGGPGPGLLGRVRSSGPVGAVVIKELRTWSRDSRRRAALLPVLVVGILLPVFPAVQNDGTGGIPFAGVTAAWFAGLAASNLYGFDGTAFWQTLVTPGAVRADVRGRVLSVLVVIGLPASLITLVLPGALGRWGMYPWALSLLAVVLGVGAGCAVFLSATAPYPLPPRTGNPFASSGNPGCAKVLVQISASLGQLFAAIPVLIVLIIGRVTGLALVEWLALPLGIAIGVGGAVYGARLAEERLIRWGPELLTVVQPR
jgi:ABC-2 type transport system permease protein